MPAPCSGSTRRTDAFAVVHNFALGTGNGVNPYAAVVQAPDGKLYGTTHDGGARNFGTIFRFDPATSAFAVIHDFDKVVGDGTFPYAGLVLASNGRLYGTSGPTVHNYGVLYEIDPATSAFAVIHEFSSSPTDGAGPQGDLIQASDGMLYGTTTQGGANTWGTVFQIDPVTHAYSVIHHFAGGPADGAYPQAAAMLQTSDGSLYGTTYSGGVGNGVVFRITPQCSPPVAVAAGSTTIVLGQSASLTGSGGVECAWSPSTGLDNPSSCTPSAGPTVTTVYSLVVTDATGCSSTNSATATVTVNPSGPATHFDISAPSNTTTGLPFTAVVTARDALNNVASGYAGTVHFSSSDGAAVLASDYAFAPSDGGAHTFTYAFRLNTVGAQTITATDTTNSSINGAAAVSVRQAVVTTWTGAVSDLWSETGNWSAGVPGSGDTLVFPPGASRLSSTNDLAVGTVFGSLVFNGGGYTIEGNGFGLSGGVGGNGSATVSTSVQLASSQTFQVSGLTLNGALDLQSYTLTVNGSGIVVNGVVSGSGGIAGSGGVELSNPANSFTGVTTTTVRLKGGKAADVAGGALVGTGSTGAVTMPFGFFQPVDLTTGVGGVLSTGNLSLSSGQFFVVINGPVAGVDYPQARVTGTVSLGNSILYLYLSSSLIPSVGQTFTFIDNDGS